MSSPISFVVPLIPTAKGRPRFARVGAFVRAFTDKRTEQAERTFASLAAPHAPAQPFDGPVALELHFVMPAPTGWPAWKRKLIDQWHHQVKPDADNVAKLCLDALNKSGQWWRDDAQVARLTITKRYGEQPGTHVVMRELEQPTRPPGRRSRPSPAQPGLFGDEP